MNAQATQYSALPPLPPHQCPTCGWLIPGDQVYCSPECEEQDTFPDCGYKLPHPDLRDHQALVVEKMTGAFLISPPEPKLPDFIVVGTLGGHERSDGGSITTIYSQCCSECRWPRLAMSSALTTDPQAIALEYAALERKGRLYRCPGCGSHEITGPTESWQTFRCAHCGRVVELANVRGSQMAQAYSETLRSQRPAEETPERVGFPQFPSPASRVK